MKTRGIFALLLSLCIISVVGCSSGGTTGTTGDKPAAQEAPALQEDKTPITIQYWHSHPDTQLDGMKMMISEFNKKYPYITVEPVFQGAYDELSRKLTAAMAAKAVPALTVSENSLMPNLAINGALTELGPYMKRDKFDVNDFSKGMMEAYALNGKQYGIPFVVSMNSLVYNKTMFDKEGIKAPETWADVNTFGQKIVKKEGNKITRYGLTVNLSGPWDYEPWILNGGGAIITKDGKSGLDQPESFKFMKQFLDWKTNGSMFITHGKGATDTAKQMFLDGELGMYEISSSGLKWYKDNAKFEIGAAFIPGDKRRVAEIGGASLVIMDMAPAKEKEAAWKFIQFVTGAENNIKIVDSLGYLPTRKSAVSSPQGQEFFKNYPYLKALYDHFDDVISRPQHPGFSETKASAQKAVDHIILENTDVETTFKASAKEVNEILKDYK
jgi:sn-glycerol 3-phosphate transport system substrate-binding protein